MQIGPLKERDAPEILREVQYGGNHYKDLAIQPAEFCQRNRLNFCESEAIKYITRHRDKGKDVDIMKAIHFLQMVLEIEYGVTSKFEEQTRGVDDGDRGKVQAARP